MSKNKIIAFKKPGEISEDPLTELLRRGAGNSLQRQSRQNFRIFFSIILI